MASLCANACFEIGWQMKTIFVECEKNHVVSYFRTMSGTQIKAKHSSFDLLHLNARNGHQRTSLQSSNNQLRER